MLNFEIKMSIQITPRERALIDLAVEMECGRTQLIQNMAGILYDESFHFDFIDTQRRYAGALEQAKEAGIDISSLPERLPRNDLMVLDIMSEYGFL